MYGEAFDDPARETGSPRPIGTLSRSIAIAVFAALLSAAAGSTFVALNSTESFFPKKWDPQVAPIAAEVAKLRGLDFEHPVAIHYLADKDFEKQLSATDDSGSDVQAEDDRDNAVFRSLGLVGGKDDLQKAEQTDESSGVLAYYDPAQKDIIVRGTTLDVEHRVTIAHELTHVLQDQHFDLAKLQKQADVSNTGDSSALRALVEGDAVRVQQDYLKQLSTTDQNEYDREDAAEGARVGNETAAVPDLVDLLFSAPYEFGPSTIRVLLESGGNDAVNDALTGPTPSTEVFTSAGDVDPPVPVDAPAPSPDATDVSPPEAFGPFEMYMTLALRIDPARSLAVANLVGGGQALSFKSNGITCYRVAVAPNDAASRAPLLDAVQSWANGRARTSVDASGDLVGFTACDPGKTAPEPSSPRFHDVEALLDFSSEIAVAAAQGHQSADFARCVARVAVGLPGAEELILGLGDREPTAAENAGLRELGAQSGAACRDDVSTGSP